jgi:tetratricopeptide (TPR) repeat protein
VDEPDLDDIFDDIDDIELSDRVDRGDMLRAGADRHPVGSEARSAYLTILGEHLQMERRYAEARAALEEVLDSGHRPFNHPLVPLLDLDLETGRTDEADELLARLLELSRRGNLEANDHEMIGESLEMCGRARDAHRWFTIPLRDVDPDDLDDLDIGCLHGRFRVRRALGMPLDPYDRASLEIKAMRARELD